MLATSIGVRKPVTPSMQPGSMRRAITPEQAPAQPRCLQQRLTTPLPPALTHRDACEAARVKVRDLLRGLSSSLDSSQLLAALANASMASVIITALGLHVEEALRRRQWSMPLLLPEPAPWAGAGAAAGAASSRGMTASGNGSSSSGVGSSASSSSSVQEALHVEGMWPYWLDGSDPATARNSHSLSSMVLLTGPNMAGKSTVLRWVYPQYLPGGEAEGGDAWEEHCVLVLHCCSCSRVWLAIEYGCPPLQQQAQQQPHARMHRLASTSAAACPALGSTASSASASAQSMCCHLPHRSFCAVALLASCGLAVPATSAQVPYIDAFMLRNFSGAWPGCAGCC
jgi:hypothetical protein